MTAMIIGAGAGIEPAQHIVPRDFTGEIN